MKSLWLLSAVAACASALLAQSANTVVETASGTIHVVPSLGAATPYVSPENTPDAGSTTPLVINAFTIIGANVTGVVCYDCVTGAESPNIGVLEPAGVAHLNQNYQVDVSLFDVNYTGSCTYTIAVLDKNKSTIVSTNPTFSENANTPILLGTAFTIPGTATVGLGYVRTTAVCGTSTSVSQSRVYIAN
jgi:hypothetical protein